MNPYFKRLRGRISSVIFITATATFALIACKNATKTTAVIPIQHPDWSYDATIYEVNVRQYTPEGTFKAFETQLPRLQKLGVKILWIMPINPIGVVERKGKLGSYYSVKDYKAINPEYGNLDDFKQLVKKAHELGFKVIIDWVANHSSRDNNWIAEHPEWYLKDSTGKIATQYDWTDVAKLDYKSKPMRAAMIEAMEYWLKEANIDGFRCDVAGEVPTDFWDNAYAQLKSIRPDLFMLAEAEKPELQKNAFDMTYAWEFHKLMNEIAQGKKTATDIDKYLKKQDSLFKQGDYRMLFTSNHDENSWNGTEFERLKDAAKTFAAFTFTMPGMPLIYSGQEAGFNKRIKFFERDTIKFPANEYAPLYTNLVTLRKNNSALWSGEKGAKVVHIKSSVPEVYAFIRQNETNKVFAIFNLSPKAQKVTLEGKDLQGTYNAFPDNASVKIDKAEYTLNPWEYKIFTATKK
ncbi:MAG: alpha-amylase [Bacteroidetes bacterium]|nr:alpha-amylase [Bacteroidota bacterium]